MIFADPVQMVSLGVEDLKKSLGKLGQTQQEPLEKIFNSVCCMYRVMLSVCMFWLSCEQ